MPAEASLPTIIELAMRAAQAPEQLTPLEVARLAFHVLDRGPAPKAPRRASPAPDGTLIHRLTGLAPQD